MRTTVTLNDQLYQSLRIRAAESNATISALVEEAVKYQLLEDLEDIDDATKRSKEPVESFDALVKTLRAEGLL